MGFLPSVFILYDAYRVLSREGLFKRCLCHLTLKRAGDIIALMRIDKFLKVSRILKRRTVAADACGSERVSVGGKPVKPAYRLKVGDIVTVAFGNRTLTFKVLSLNEKVSKEEASSLYEICGDE